MEEIGEKKFLSRRRSTVSQSLKIKDERMATVKKVRKIAAILQKPEASRTEEECEILLTCSDIVKEVNLRQEKRDKVKARLEEIEDPVELLEEKCIRLAAAISRASSLTVYTGAGISTAASIPDYRGTNGVWTRMQQGKDIGNHDLSQAEPTITHMALYSLYKAGILKYVVSQNCDGLHLRSGIPRSMLSEVHGNMYIEVCRTCKPSREYWRLFDVTEKTARYAHSTGRLCHKCNSPLQDSIVHFGERGNLLWPINWNGASKAAKQADVILCLGSSLKVLKRYPWLWQMDKPVSKRAQLYIVNLQWTPKDENSVLKINGKCDEVMRIVLSHLGIDIPAYNRVKDPIFYHAVKLQSNELLTTSNPSLELPQSLKEEEDDMKSVKKDEESEHEDENGDEDENGHENEMGHEEEEEVNNHEATVGEEIPKTNGNSHILDTETDRDNVLTEEAVEKNESIEETKEHESQIAYQEEKEREPQLIFPEPISAYSAPFFAALPFLSMGLPFPPMYLYPQLTPIFYYQPLLQMAANTFAQDFLPKPKPACDYCMDHESSLTCLYYQRDGDGQQDTFDLPVMEPLEDNEMQENGDKTAVDDENAPAVATAKNPGWFGKGYKKGIRKKR